MTSLPEYGFGTVSFRHSGRPKESIGIDSLMCPRDIKTWTQDTLQSFVMGKEYNDTYFNVLSVQLGYK